MNEKCYTKILPRSKAVKVFAFTIKAIGSSTNISNMKFGKLTALFRCNSNRKGTRWCCLCSCGNVVDVGLHDITSGLRTSCGCDAKRPSRIDLTGQRFGRLFVLEKVYHDNEMFWRCLCDCGNYVEVRSQPLRNGHTKSCGCLKREIEQSMIGRRFGRLLVIQKIGSSSNQADCDYLCLCDCGSTHIASYDGLLGGNTNSCGCLRKEIMSQNRRLDLTNKKFNLLTAIECVGKNKYGNYLWKCICECGNTAVYQATQLVNGNALSCGCLVSNGEKIITNILREANIDFEKQYMNDNCRKPISNRMYRFDFRINKKYIIEFDGIQHFKECNFFNHTLKDIRYNDLLKDSYCFQNNIPIIRIPYTHLNNICLEDLLLETSRFILTPENESEYFTNSEQILGGEMTTWTDLQKLSA